MVVLDSNLMLIVRLALSDSFYFMDFFNIIVLIVKIGFALLAITVILRWIAIPYLWFKYDRPIQKISDDFENFKKMKIEDAEGRGITTAILDRQIGSEKEKVMERLNILELKRRHFLDRINLFLTVSSLGK